MGRRVPLRKEVGLELKKKEGENQAGKRWWKEDRLSAREPG